MTNRDNFPTPIDRPPYEFTNEDFYELVDTSEFSEGFLEQEQKRRIDAINKTRARSSVGSCKIKFFYPDENGAYPQLTYLEVLAETGSPGKAVKAVWDKHKFRISTSAVRDYRLLIPKFDEACNEALEQFYGKLESTAVDRAVNGVTEDVFHQGCVVGEKTKYSDDLLKFLLQGNMPNKYRTKTENSAGSGVINVQINQFPEDADYIKATEGETIDAEYEDATPEGVSTTQFEETE